FALVSERHRAELHEAVRGLAHVLDIFFDADRGCLGDELAAHVDEDCYAGATRHPADAGDGRRSMCRAADADFVELAGGTGQGGADVNVVGAVYEIRTRTGSDDAVGLSAREVGQRTTTDDDGAAC